MNIYNLGSLNIDYVYAVEHFVSGDTRVFRPIYPVPTVDTTAAGDTFTGYFLAALTGGKDAAFSMDAAARAAAVTVSRPGAAASIPVWEETIGNA